MGELVGVLREEGRRPEVMGRLLAFAEGEGREWVAG
jgi:hypothetical protein